MKKVYSFGFGLNWNFHQEEHPSTTRILKDLEIVLSICQKHELLNSTYYLDDDVQKHFFEEISLEAIIKDLYEKVEGQELAGEIVRIGGDGWIYLDSGEKVRQTDLLTIDSIRLFQRSITVQTRINCWTPLAMDDAYDFHWQVDLSLLNESRLERCLREIKQSLGGKVEPEEDEIDRDQPVWQKGFRLYWDPEILQREYAWKPPETPCEFEKYLLATDQDRAPRDLGHDIQSGKRKE